ncbi:MAG: hypothetical protein WCP89_02865 [archaeon]
MVMEVLQYVSILIELAIAVLGVIMIYRKKSLGWFFLITFGIYVFYDFIKLRGIVISSDVMYLSFFIATLSALILTWRIYKKK